MKRRDGMKRNEHVNDMPDIEILDLENETVQDTDFGKSDISYDFEENPDDEYEENDREEEEEEHPAPKGIRRFLNLHVLFALVLLVVVGLLGYRITHWGQRVSQSDIFKDGQGSYDDSWDSILPLTDENGKMIVNDASNIVVFGNAPLPMTAVLPTIWPA